MPCFCHSWPTLFLWCGWKSRWRILWLLGSRRMESSWSVILALLHLSSCVNISWGNHQTRHHWHQQSNSKVLDSFQSKEIFNRWLVFLSLNCSFTNSASGNLTWTVDGEETIGEEDESGSWSVLTLDWEDLGKVVGDVVSVQCSGEAGSVDNNATVAWSSYTSVKTILHH